MRLYFPLSPTLLVRSSLPRTRLQLSRTLYSSAPHIRDSFKRFASTMSLNSDSPAKENVVVVGGGLAGTILAKELSAKLDHSKFNLVVVETRPYLVWMLGAARMTTATEGSMDDYFFKYDKFLPAGKGTVKNAKVEKIVPNGDGASGELELSGGEVLPYRGKLTPTVTYVIL